MLYTFNKFNTTTLGKKNKKTKSKKKAKYPKKNTNKFASQLNNKESIHHVLHDDTLKKRIGVKKKHRRNDNITFTKKCISIQRRYFWNEAAKVDHARSVFTSDRYSFLEILSEEGQRRNGVYIID